MVEEPFPPGHLLVLRPRRPDPTPPARVSPPSHARRSRARLSATPWLAAAAVVTAALLLVGQSAMATQASYQITALTREQAGLLAERDQLQAELAQARAAYRVEGGAEALGMARPSRWAYLRQADSPIALGPHAPEHSDLLSTVFSAVGAAMGTPVEAEAKSN